MVGATLNFASDTTLIHKHELEDISYVEEECLVFPGRARLSGWNTAALDGEASQQI